MCADYWVSLNKSRLPLGQGAAGMTGSSRKPLIHGHGVYLVGPKHVLVIVGFKWFPGDGGPFGALGPCSGKGVGGVKKS